MTGFPQSAISNPRSAICLIPGDGVGREVIPAAAEVLAALGLGLEFVEAQAGFDRFRRAGDAIPPETLADVEAAGLALFGATSSPSEIVAGYRSPIVVLRKTFDLYANLRPTLSLPGAFSRPNVDLLIVRENTEGLYAGRERREGETAIAERVITARGSERIARVAFEQARGRKSQIPNPKPQSLISNLQSHVTIVHKANVLKVTDGLFRETCLKVAAEFPEVKVSEMLVDAMAMRLVRDPERFDVIVTTNLFGDILSDEASALMGGLGVAPSANVGARVAVFEPVHGSAPDIAGKGIANPIGAILSAGMLLDHIGCSEAAHRVRTAVMEMLKAGIMTPDLGGNATTAEVTRRIVAGL
ncbi:MAG: isocitrate/isopropylmalate dehydrogenase family protein [Chloroflexi bacterium]|nr:isocitrate/isopropylmalate dehydrogenase family protein [Chloroflexota bacterium]